MLFEVIFGLFGCIGCFGLFAVGLIVGVCVVLDLTWVFGLVRFVGWFIASFLFIFC